MSSNESGEIVVRRATQSDCDGIRNINRNLYGGGDYFMFTFHQLVEQQNRFPYVAEVKGDIVGYTCGHVINDGEAIILETARVSEKLQGRKIVNMMSETMISDAVRKFPNLRKALWTSSSKTVSGQSMKKHPFIEQVDCKHILLMKVNTAALKVVCDSKQFREMEQKLQIKQIRAVPKHEALRLLTEEIQFLDYTPKIPIIKWEPSGWHHSTLAEQLLQSNLHVTKCKDTGSIKAFSFDSVGYSNKGVHCFIDLFSESEGSTDLMLSHILWHMRGLALMQNFEEVFCSLHFPGDIVKEDVRKSIEDLGLTVNPDIGLNTMLLAANISSMFVPKNKL